MHHIKGTKKTHPSPPRSHASPPTPPPPRSHASPPTPPQPRSHASPPIPPPSRSQASPPNPPPPRSTSQWNVWARQGPQRHSNPPQYSIPSSARCRPHPSPPPRTSVHGRHGPSATIDGSARRLRPSDFASSSSATPMEIDGRPPSTLRSHRPPAPSSISTRLNPVRYRSSPRGIQQRSQLGPKSYLQALTSPLSPSWVQRLTSAPPRAPRRTELVSNKFPCTPTVFSPPPSRSACPANPRRKLLRVQHHAQRQCISTRHHISNHRRSKPPPSTLPPLLPTPTPQSLSGIVAPLPSMSHPQAPLPEVESTYLNFVDPL